MIQVFRPVLHVEECLAGLREVLETGWLGLGPKTAEFESRMAGLVGAAHFVATNSCTAALQLALHCLNLAPGSRVFTTPITFVSTNMALLYEGLVPVFCDVEPTTGNLNPQELDELASAVLAVHIGGYPCDAAAIRALGLPVVWDCAHALGSSFRPEGDLACWSFHAVKNLPMGDGGGVSTDDPEIAARLRRLRWLGIDKSTAERTDSAGYAPEYEVRELGFKAHMNDVAAAIGLAELDHLQEGNRRRAEIAARYRAGLKRVIYPGYHSADRRSSYHFFPLFFHYRDRVAERLRERGIFPGMHYRRNDRYPLFANCARRGELPGAAWYEAHELTLPLHLAMSDADVEEVIAAVNQATA